MELFDDYELSFLATLKRRGGLWSCFSLLSQLWEQTSNTRMYVYVDNDGIVSHKALFWGKETNSINYFFEFVPFARTLSHFNELKIGQKYVRKTARDSFSK